MVRTFSRDLIVYIFFFFKIGKNYSYLTKGN